MGYTYRTAGPWGPGLGTDLTPAQVDENFWQAVQDIAAKAPAGVGISNMIVSGNQLTVVLTDHTVLGPYTLPTAAFSFQGEWQPDHAYLANDIFTHGGSTYIVLQNHTSAATFDPNATDGLGHDLYGLLLQNPAAVIPAGGAAGMFLRKVTIADYVVAWQTAALTDLSDTNIVSPAADQYLIYLHGKWTNSPLVASLENLSDVHITSIVTGQVLTWGGSNWINQTPITTVAGLSDVFVSAPVVGQVLMWSGSPAHWVNGHPALATLSDVTLTTLYPNQPLIYNSTAAKWQNLNAADMLLQDLGSVTTTVTIDFSSYEFNRIQVMGPITLTFTWPSRSGQFVRRALEIVNTSSFAVTWPAGIKWAGGIAPTVSFSATDVYVFWSHDSGTTVYGNTVGQNYS